MYKAVIMDMDGTIIDSLPAIESTLRAVCAKLGIPATEEIVNLALYSTNERIYDLLGGDEGARAFLAEWGDIYHEAAKKTKMFPGMEKVLDAPLRRAIVTSETEKELTWNIKRLGVSLSRFECLVGADTTEHIKPHPRPLLYCLSKMGIEPGEALYVGDSLSDMRCAAAAGVSFALARFGKGETVDEAGLAAMGFAGMKYILSRPEEILDIMAEKEGR